MSKTATSPSFISRLKEYTLQTTARTKYTFRPRDEVLAKLVEISDREDVSGQKLLEYAIESLHARWAAERVGKKAG